MSTMHKSLAFYSNKLVFSEYFLFPFCLPSDYLLIFTYFIVSVHSLSQELIWLPWRVWLSWLEHHPIRQKVVDSIPGQSTYRGNLLMFFSLLKSIKTYFQVRDNKQTNKQKNYSTRIVLALYLCFLVVLVYILCSEYYRRLWIYNLGRFSSTFYLK